MEKLTLFKVGGKILDDAKALKDFLKGFAKVPGKKILVHGGGIFADQLAKQLGIEVEMHEGRRITSPAMRDLVTMVYGGLLQKQLVAHLQSYGCDALGLSGADAALLPATRRNPQPIDFGCVGDIESINVERLEQFLSLGLTPVICPLSWDPLQGEMLNSNADGVACRITEALAHRYETTLLYCFDKAGVLLDLNDPTSLLPSITPSVYSHLKSEAKVHTGMVPKLDSCFRAKAAGAKQVLLASPDQSLAYASAQPFRGTLIELN